MSDRPARRSSGGAAPRGGQPPDGCEASDGGEVPESGGAADVLALYERKALAELALADAEAGPPAVGWSGAAIADVAAVRGEPDAEDVAAGAALAGAVGEAVDRALAALGFDPAAVFRTCSRPDPALAPAVRARRLRLQLEAADPKIAVAIDPVAADDLAAAFGLAALAPGRPVRAGGRLLLAVDDLAASLSDESRKRRVWAQLKSLRGALADR